LVIPASVIGSIALIAFSATNAVVALTFTGRSLTLNSSIVAEVAAVLVHIVQELVHRNIRFNQEFVTVARNYSLGISLMIFEVLGLDLLELFLQS
jgi:hypothetical protein